MASLIGCVWVFPFSRRAELTRGAFAMDYSPFLKCLRHCSRQDVHDLCIKDMLEELLPSRQVLGNKGLESLSRLIVEEQMPDYMHVCHVL